MLDNIRETYKFYLTPLEVSDNEFARYEDRINKKDYLLFSLQDEIHDLLNCFINGESLTHFSMLLYPLVDRDYNKFSSVSKLIDVLHNDFSLEFSDSIKLMNMIKRKKTLSSFETAKLISTLCNEFYSIKLREIKREFVRVKKPTDFMDWKEKLISEKIEHIQYFGYVLKIRNYFLDNLTSFMKGFYLHGSLSSLDYVKGWSDVDTLLILNEKIATSTALLLEVKKKIYRAQSLLYMIDPVQHHGYPIILEQEMELFSQHFFPLVLFNHSTTIWQNCDDLTFYVRDSSFELRRMFLTFVISLIETCKGNKKPVNAYQWKQYFSMLMLLPTLYLEVKGEYYYKRYSFDVARNDFSYSDWEVIQILSSIRKNWNLKRLFPLPIERKLSNFSNPNLLFLFYYLLRGLPSNIKKYNLQKLLCRSSNFVKSALRNLEEGGYL